MSLVELRRTLSLEAIVGSLVIGLAMALVYELLILPSWPREFVPHFAMALVWPLEALFVLLSLAVADASLGNSGWRHVARALAVSIAIVVGIELAWLAVADLVPPRYRERYPRDKIDWMLTFATYAIVCVPLYYLARRTREHQRQLREAEAGQAEQAQRLARQQLAAQLAQVDYELVISVMRDAHSQRLAAPHKAEQGLDRLVDYLRAAQQREGLDRERVERSLDALRSMR